MEMMNDMRLTERKLGGMLLEGQVLIVCQRYLT